MLHNAAKLKKRARRAARNVKNGLAIYDRLEQPDSVALMIKGAKEGIPSVVNIAAILRSDFPVADIKTAPVKTLVGQITRAVLAEHDYELVERGVRTGTLGDEDHLFTTGSVYAKADPEVAADEEDDDSDELLDLIVAVSEKLLNERDRKRLIDRLDQ